MRISGSSILGLICCMAFMATPPAAQADWSIHPGTANNPGCELETAKITLHDGYQDTRIRLNINDQRLLVITESNIDIGSGDAGLQVDGKAMIPPDTVVDEQNVEFSSNIATIVEQFRKGNTVRVHLRFWPSYPATQRYGAVFSLAGFTRAWDKYQACRGADSGIPLTEDTP